MLSDAMQLLPEGKHKVSPGVFWSFKLVASIVSGILFWIQLN